MKLAYCIPSLYNPGGMEKVLVTKINYLIQKCNYEIIIITTEGINKNSFFNLDKEVKIYELNINFDIDFNKTFLIKSINHFYKLYKYKKKILEILTRERIDICISLIGKEIDFISSLKDGSLKIGELHFAKNFRIQFSQSINQNYFFTFLAKIRTKQLENKTKKLSNLVVLTKADKTEWLKTNKNIIQIYNPLSIRPSEISNVGNKKVLAIGRLDAQKGFDNLILAWKIVNQNYPEWKLEIYGQGVWHDKLLTMISEQNLQESCYLMGISNNLNNVFLDSSIFVLSSRYEGFGLVLAEAMSYGIPCVSYDCEFGPNEIIDDGFNGFLVEKDNISELSEKINYLIKNQSLRQLMSINARNSSLRFDLNIIMEKWIELFESIKINQYNIK